MEQLWGAARQPLKERAQMSYCKGGSGCAVCCGQVLKDEEITEDYKARL